MRYKWFKTKHIYIVRWKKIILNRYVMFIFLVATYGWRFWTISQPRKKTIKAFELKHYTHVLRITRINKLKTWHSTWSEYRRNLALKQHCVSVAEILWSCRMPGWLGEKNDGELGWRRKGQSSASHKVDIGFKDILDKKVQESGVLARSLEYFRGVTMNKIVKTQDLINKGREWAASC